VVDFVAVLYVAIFCMFANCRHDWRETYTIPMHQNWCIFFSDLCRLLSRQAALMWNLVDHQVDWPREWLLRCRQLRPMTYWTIVWRLKKVNC